MEDLKIPTEHPPLRFEGGDGDPRVSRIIEAAYDLLDEEGIDGLTIRAVLNRTGLARRAFYENFAGKDDLVLAVFEQTIHLAAAHYRQMTSGLDSPIERLAMIVLSIGMGSANPETVITTREPGLGPGNRSSAALSREHLRLADSRPKELEKALAPLLALFAELLRDGIAAGQVRDCDTDLLASLIYNLVSTTVHTQLLAEEAGRIDPERRQRLARELWEFCRRAIVV